MIKRKELTKKMIQHDDAIAKKQTFLGVKPSPEDKRDFTPKDVAAGPKRELPEEFESAKTEILDQESVGSCVAHSCVTAIAKCEEARQKGHADYSRGYIYGNRRAGDFQGEGMVIREALRQLNHCGDVYYKDFPYNYRYPEVKALIEQDKDNLAAKAEPHKIIDYYRCYSEDEIKEAVYDRGACIICVPIYSSLERNQSKPAKKEKVTGYHAMVIVGWTKNNEWIVQNSWGKDWGYKGKLLLDMDYPISEYWGLTAATADKEAIKKKSWFAKLISAIRGFFIRLFK